MSRCLLVLWGLLLAGCCADTDCSVVKQPFGLTSFSYDSAALSNAKLAYVSVASGAVVDTGKIEDVSRASELYYNALFSTRFANGISASHYLRVVINGTDTFRVTELRYYPQGCNSCYPIRRATRFEDDLTGCIVNGQYREGKLINLQ